MKAEYGITTVQRSAVRVTTTVTVFAIPNHYPISKIPVNRVTVGNSDNFANPRGSHCNRHQPLRELPYVMDTLHQTANLILFPLSPH